ncbi:MAG TPA: hypothetical protein DCL61_09020 [Cyanobacteria bacterium UBA12227]|nr:hypothetical protein [Cyanobacteria bacterium UBA12227]HAX87831.1 hypothetical protein [Cyanobacteria bacterium UBA11370]
MKTRQLRLGICLASALLGCLWVAFEKLLFPSLSAQNGLLICLGFGIVAWITTSPSFFRRFVGDATPESLGAIRIITCAIQLMMTLWLEDLPSSALLPEEIRHSMGIMKYFYTLPGFEAFVRNQAYLQIFEWLTALILFLGLIGWRTRIVIPLGAFCYLILGGILRQYTWFYHTGLIPVYVMAILSLTPCADGLSVDRLRKVYQGKTVPVADQAFPIYGWSRYACWVVIAISYVQAGLSKIYKSGWYWWDPENMKSILFSSNLDPVQTNWGVSLHLVHAPNVVFAILGFAGMYGEIVYGLVLFSKIARKVLPIFMAGLHIGILFLQDILFFDLIILQLIFYDFTETRKTIQRWIRPREGSIEVLYDGSCSVCCRTIRLLECFDLFERLQFIDFRQLDISDYNSDRNLGLTEDYLQAKLCVIRRGRPYLGFDGFRLIARVLPIFWLLLPCLFLPGLSSISQSVYKQVTTKDFKPLQAESQSEITPRSTKELTPIGSLWDALRNFYYPLIISGLTVTMIFIWFKHTEFYPLTSLQMFSGYNNSGSVGYTKLIAHYESGETARIFPDTIIHPPMNTRYRLTMKGCLRDEPKGLYKCDKLLETLASVHNQKVLPGERIVKFEVQHWSWDYRSNPSDPNYGERVGGHTYEITKQPR